jgi:acyl-CoA synthetase (AMP-forming)/AMP-acid ligase II
MGNKKVHRIVAMLYFGALIKRMCSGSINEQGELYLCTQSKDTIVLQGRNIYLETTDRMLSTIVINGLY